jgi:transposase InsO family protein
VELLILALRADNPGWGARTIHSVLTRQGYQDLPCIKTVNNILNRYGCIAPEESLKRHPFTRFEKDRCNVMWQTDFKGEFRMGDNNYCYPLTILDDHSRFSLKIAPRLSTANVVIPVFLEVFREYGIPDSILSDNGAQFAGFKKGYTQFEKWLMEQDILPIHGRIKHPQTQGKIERFHRTMKQELLNHVQIADIADAENKFVIWRDKYNTIRPHEALGMRTPGEVYKPSQKQYKEKVEKFEYGGEYHIIKVNNWGYARFAGYQVYLSETMADQYIEFRPGQDNESFIACYRNFRIAEFDAEDGHLIHRSIARL